MYNAQVSLNSSTAYPQRNYPSGMVGFLVSWLKKGQTIPDKLFLRLCMFVLREKLVGDESINIRLCAIIGLAGEGADLKFGQRA